MRVDPALAVCSALLFGACLAVQPAPTALAALLLMLLLRKPLGLIGIVVGAAAVALGGLRARAAIDAFERERVEARDALGPPARCAARARVLRSPTRSAGTTRFFAELDEIDCEGRRLRAGFRARLYGGPDDLARGDIVEVVAQLAPLRLFRNAGASDPTPGAARQGVVLSGGCLAAEVVERGHGLAHAIDAARAHARRRIEATFAPAAAPLARALVLGESDLDPEDDAAFRKSGLSHLLAVSGTHLVFAVVALVSGLRFLLVRIELLAARTDVRRLAAALGAPLALGYADFAGGSGSAWRAAWMLVAAFTAIALARRPSASRTLAASFLVASVVDPLAAFDVSFLLSAAATAGLIALGQPLAARCENLRPKPLRWLALSIVATTSSMLPCTPLLGLMTPDLTLAGIFANVIAAPLGEVVALPACLLHPLLGWVPALERGAALVASGALVFVARTAHAAAAATALSFTVPPPGAWHLVLIAVAAGGSLGATAGARPFLMRTTWCVALASSLALVELAARRAGKPHGELRVQALDVEQGDALLVDLPDGRLILIDGGGYVGSPIDTGRSVLLPVLRERRRRHVDIAVLSHPHPDHFGGLASALPELDVGELWDTGQGEAEGAGPVYASLVRSLRGRRVPLRRPSALCGAPRFFGAARLDVLAPCPTFTPGRDANDNSFVIRIAFGRHAVLLTGDAEAQEEAELVARYGARLRADLLKVGHHGSRTSSTQPLLQAVRPSVATVSCGVRNRYGHPHHEALVRLHASNAHVLRLDRSGSVLWRSDGLESALFAFAPAR